VYSTSVFDRLTQVYYMQTGIIFLKIILNLIYFARIFMIYVFSHVMNLYTWWM